jgi:hypothetical protein
MPEADVGLYVRTNSLNNYIVTECRKYKALGRFIAHGVSHSMPHRLSKNYKRV